MAKWQIDMRVDYSFEIEAETADEAERLAWEYNYSDDQMAYQGVYSIDVEEIDEPEDDEDEEGDLEDED
jgi:hypothetical protein